MKLIHLSDLHLGKRVNGFPMLEDQAFILRQIREIAAREAPDALLIAGDIYDKPVPPAEAVELFDDFLFALSELVPDVFVISGNHDSPERIAFGSRLMARSGVHLSPVYSGAVEPTVLTDACGEIHVYMLPFIKPVHVRRYFPEEPAETYSQAVATAIAHMDVDPSVRNILVTHQFVTGAVRSDSEDVTVGGTDNVDASVFDPFDYVALGHIHRPQSVGRDTIRYCGTPLKYSFSEMDHQKSVTIAELGAKGDISLRTAPLTPRHDLREIRGTHTELLMLDSYRGTAADDYLRVVLTDEDPVRHALELMRTVYPNIMLLEYDNVRTRTAADLTRGQTPETRTELELLAELYRRQNGQPLSPAQEGYAAALFDSIREADT